MDTRKATSSAYPRLSVVVRLAAIAALSLGSATAQSGLTIPSYHPRIWFDGPNGARLAKAKTWFATHPFTPTRMADWALHSLLSGNATDCTGAGRAIAMAKSTTETFAGLEGVASDTIRTSGEAVALVYDWCYAQMTPADAQFLRDRWAGTTLGPSDPIHIPNDLASIPGTNVMTSNSSPFLPNMAGNNVVIISGGTNCRARMFGIVTYTNANSVVLDADPTNGLNATGCTGRISGYVDSATPHSWTGQWGGTYSPGSNYSWGYFRNEVLWGAVLYGDSAYAPVFLDAALGPAASSRWSTFLTYAGGTGLYAAPKSNAAGGVLTEGTDYGVVMWGYQTTPDATAKLLGRNLFTETNWFRESIYYVIYSTTVAPTLNNATAAYYQFFPMSDTENFSSSNGSYPGVDFAPTIGDGGWYGAMMLTLAQEYASVNTGKYARQWLNTINPQLLLFQAAVDPGGAALPFAGNLPLDFYSSGQGMLVSKNTWAPTATQMRTISGIASSSGHNHRNSGDFAMLRKGVWLTKESTNYATSLVGPYGQSAGTTSGFAHNTIMMGPAAATTCNVSQNGSFGFGQTVRLESQANYSYQVMDLTNAYRGYTQGNNCFFDNPYAGGIQREFLFIRPLETLVIFDRLLAVDDRHGGDTHPSVPPASNVKTVYIHSIVNPTLTANTATFTTQGQTLKVLTLLPASPSYNVVTEGAGAQQRLEISDTGQAQSYILNVLQGRDAVTGQDFSTASVVDNGTYYTLTLQHPTLGNAVVTFMKGAASSGGSFGYAASGTPTPSPLASGVSSVIVDDNGVRWQAAGAAATCDLNGDGKTDLADVSLSVQQALGQAPCTGDLDQNGVCNVIDVQRVINASITGVCKIGP